MTLHHHCRRRPTILLAMSVLAFVITLVASPSVAHAFHAGNLFDKPAGAGGGGGIFYTGAAREKAWSCVACHRDPASTIKVTLSSDPPALLQSFQYEPGKTYALQAKLEGEHVGAGASNFNSLAVTIVNASDGLPAGEIGGYAADEFYSGGPTTIVSAGQHPGENTWKFSWTAPPSPGSGSIKIHLAAVDGNGANGEGGGTLTDPWGDDVFVGALTIDQAGGATPSPTTSASSATTTTTIRPHSSAMPPLFIFGVVAFAFVRVKARGRGKSS